MALKQINRSMGQNRKPRNTTKNSYMEPHRTPNRQSKPKKKEQSWRYHTPWFQTILQSCGNQNSMVLAENRDIDQWNRTESLGINPDTYGKNIFYKSVKAIHWGKKSLFNIWCKNNYISTCKKMNLNLTSHHTKN